MNISEAAAKTGLSAKQIRDYEKQNLLPETKRTQSGYRTYSAAQIERLHFIRHARAVGFSLAQIRQLLVLQDNPNRHSQDVKQLTAQHIAKLNNKIADMTRMRDTLQAWHDQCLGNEQSACCILDGLNFISESQSA